MSAKDNESVKVVVRCRPMGDKEELAGYERVVEMDTANGVVGLRNPNKPDVISREFKFDSVYDWNSIQVNLYDVTFRPIVNAVLEGYNGTIFAYGQTGTGKTYTMEGVRSNPEERGVIPNSFNHIFSHIDSSENQQYLVRASYLEIYKEEIRDLLSKDHKKRLDVGERPDTGVYVKDLSSFIAKGVKEIEHVMSIGNQNRAVGRTDMNEHSSRSHAIFIVTVECAEQGSDGEDHIRVGKLNLVDLAGSERQSKTQSTGDRFKEAIKINLSLSALGNVISALVNPKSTHIPYRDSMLTYLLSDSLGGNSKTVMVANIGPASYNYEETLVTLRYANRAKKIQNKPHINEDPKDALLREYQEEIKRLKETLDQRKGGTRGHPSKHKKRKGRGGEGTGHTDSESPEESGGEEEGGRERLQREREELEKERKLIQENTGMMEEEKHKLLTELQKKVEEVRSESKKMDSLTNKIKTMESKLLSGGTVKISQHEREERKRDIQRKRDEMIEMKKRTEKIQKELEQRDDLNVEVQGNYLTLHEENIAKEKKLKKLQKKLKMAESEMEDCHEEQCRYREELTQQLLLMEKQLKLRQLIIDHFIPSSEVRHVQDSHVYSEGRGAWLPRDTPTSDCNATLTSGPHPSLNEDFLAMNNVVVKLDVDMPTRTTNDYSPQSQLTSPVMDRGGEDCTVDALSVKQSIAAPTMDPRSEFPLSRGLIKRNK